MDTGNTLSVIIAAYNEESVIEKNILSVLEHLNKNSPCANWELICVNDGSKDKTGQILDRLSSKNLHLTVLHHRRNFGQGQALRTAFEHAKGSIILTMDADLSYGPEYINKLYESLVANNADISLASAYMKGGKVLNVPLYRYILSRGGNWYLGRMFDYSIATSTCVVRAYRADTLRALKLSRSGMEMQLEVLMKASLHGLTVIEIPATLAWEQNKAKESSFRRVSKMRIMRSIRLYLMLGWIAKPAFAMLFISLLFFIPGLYMAAVLVWRFFQNLFSVSLSYLSLSERISESMSIIFANHTYSLVFSGIFLFIGFQMAIFSLLFLQAKHYNEEMYMTLTSSSAPSKIISKFMDDIKDRS